MPGIVAIVEETLQKRFASIISTDQMEVGGVPYIADIMNHVDRSTEKYIFDELSENDPELAEGIRKLMFVSKTSQISTAWLCSVSSARSIQGSGDCAQSLERGGQGGYSAQYVFENARKPSKPISSTCIISGCVMLRKRSRRLSA